MEIAESMRIASPPARVWAVLADFGHISRWARSVDHSAITTTQPDGVGAVRRVQISRAAVLERNAGWQPGSRLGCSVEGVPFVGGVVNTWTLSGDERATVVNLTSRIDANPMVAWLAGRVMARELRKLLEGMKSDVEEGS